MWQAVNWRPYKGMCADEGKGSVGSKDLLPREEMGVGGGSTQTAPVRAGTSHPPVCLFYVHFPLQCPTCDLCVTNT